MTAEVHGAGERRAATVELSFDLTFVFAVTQITHLLEAVQGIGDVIGAGLYLAGSLAVAILGAALPVLLHLPAIAVLAVTPAIALAAIGADARLPSGKPAR